jgi:hypothetical protein
VKTQCIAHMSIACNGSGQHYENEYKTQCSKITMRCVFISISSSVFVCVLLRWNNSYMHNRVRYYSILHISGTGKNFPMKILPRGKTLLYKICIGTVYIYGINIPLRTSSSSNSFYAAHTITTLVSVIPSHSSSSTEWIAIQSIACILSIPLPVESVL